MTTTSPSTANKEGEYDAVEYDAPKVILGRLVALENDIAKEREELERLLP